jgi:branched-chain amino acid transport system ATP-binding protein
MRTLLRRREPEPAPVEERGAPGAPLIAADGIVVTYGRMTAVRGVDLALAPGEALCLVGPNGAGKTSLANALAGLRQPSDGDVRWRGSSIRHRDLRWRIDHGIVYVPEGTQVFSSMTVAENLEVPLLAQRRAVQASSFDAVYQLFPVLRRRAEQTAGTLSGGENRMLAIARALVLEPRLLIVDEPSLGLSPQATETLASALRRLTELGQTTLVTEQNLACAAVVGGRAGLMVRGEIRWWGSADQLHEVEVVRHAVLGRGLS